jgi:hypothetical protein
MARKPVKNSNHGGAACFVNPDGTVSDQEHHDQIMDGVDDREQILFAREQCKDVLTKAELDRLFPLPPKSPSQHNFESPRVAWRPVGLSHSVVTV